MTNKSHSTLYIGVTSDIVNRAYEHKSKQHPQSFTARYNCDKLVYYYYYAHIEEAISAEKKLKGRSRKYKQELISSANPQWKDLYDGVV